MDLSRFRSGFLRAIAAADTKRSAKSPGKCTHFAPVIPVLRYNWSASKAKRDDVDKGDLANLHTRLFQAGEPQ